MRLSYPALALILLGAAGCDGWESDSSDGSYVTLQELDQSAQPSTSDLGVLVAVLATGGSAVELRVGGGALDDGETSSCLLIQGGSQGFAFAVHPTKSEALVTAILGNAEAEGDATAESAGSVDAALDGGADASAVFFATTTCNGRAFHSLGLSSTLVVSLGRAPAPPASGPQGGDAAPEVGQSVGDASLDGETGEQEDAGSDSEAADGGADANGAESASDSPSDASNEGDGS